MASASSSRTPSSSAIGTFEMSALISSRSRLVMRKYGGAFDGPRHGCTDVSIADTILRTLFARNRGLRLWREQLSFDLPHLSSQGPSLRCITVCVCVWNKPRPARTKVFGVRSRRSGQRKTLSRRGARPVGVRIVRIRNVHHPLFDVVKSETVPTASRPRTGNFHAYTPKSRVSGPCAIS